MNPSKTTRNKKQETRNPSTLTFITDPLPQFPVTRFFAIHQDAGAVYFCCQPGGE